MKFKRTAVLGLSTLVMGSSMLVPLEPATSATLITRHTPQKPSSVSDLLNTHMLSANPGITAEELEVYHGVYKDAWKQALRQQTQHSKLSFLRTLFIPAWLSKKDLAPVIAKSVPLTPVLQVAEEVEIAAQPAVHAEPQRQSAPATQSKTLPETHPQESSLDTMKPILESLIQRNEVQIPDSALLEEQRIYAPRPATNLNPMPQAKPIHTGKKRAVKTVITAAPAKKLLVTQKIVTTPPAKPINQPLISLAPSGETLVMAATSELTGLQEPDEMTVRKPVPVKKAPWNPTASAGSGSAPVIAGVSEESVVLHSGITKNISALDLTMGKAKVLKLSKPATRVSISNPEIANAVVISPTQIQLVGKQVGVANLLVWSDMDSANHTVVDINVHRDVSVLVRQLNYVDTGIKIVPMAAEDTVILTGQAESREAAQLAVEMAKAFFKAGSSGGGSAGAAMGGGNNAAGPSSRAPGSAIPGASTNIINLIKVKGEPSTKLELVRNRLKVVDPNIQVDIVPGADGSEKVVLSGRVLNASIAAKAINLAAVFYGKPGMQVVSGPGGNPYTEMVVNNGSGGSSSGGSGGSGGASGSATPTNLLQGSVVTDATGNVISMMEIAQKPQIRCSIKFLEIKKTGLDALGATMTATGKHMQGASLSGNQSTHRDKPVSSFDTSLTGTALGTSSSVTGGTRNASTNGMTTSMAQVINNGVTQIFTLNEYFNIALQAIEERRMARTLAEPTLTMLSGERGSFLAGGEVPIAFVGGDGQISVQYHEFGIRLNLIPAVTDDGKINIQVAPEVSSIDPANGITSNFVAVPAFSTRRMQTTLQVENGQSFILAGLFSQDDINSASGFPTLSKLPVIGSLLRNKWAERKSSEMVVIVKPEIMMNPDATTASNDNNVASSQ